MGFAGGVGVVGDIRCLGKEVQETFTAEFRTRDFESPKNSKFRIREFQIQENTEISTVEFNTENSRILYSKKFICEFKIRE